MMTKPDWNPELYLKFNQERIQPSIDLVARIQMDNPGAIIDIGCGPGNSTQILAERWPHAKVTGIDNSPSMIEKARKDYPNQEWHIADAGKDFIAGTYDIVFSNAAIQWMPDHAALMKKFHTLLHDKGILAIQVPMFWEMLIGQSIQHVAQSHRWAPIAKNVKDIFTMHEFGFYYDVLSKLFKKIDIWETFYMHQMESHSAILEMISSTGLKPYFEVLQSDEDKKDFEQLVLQRITKDYPTQENGKVIFPFKRLFLLAQK